MKDGRQGYGFLVLTTWITNPNLPLCSLQHFASMTSTPYFSDLLSQIYDTRLTSSLPPGVIAKKERTALTMQIEELVRTASGDPMSRAEVEEYERFFKSMENN